MKLNELKPARHLVFEADGTRISLVIADDPDGGLLVAWPDGRWLGRWYRQSGSIHSLAGKIPQIDLRNISHAVIRACS